LGVGKGDGVDLAADEHLAREGAGVRGHAVEGESKLGADGDGTAGGNGKSLVGSDAQ